VKLSAPRADNSILTIEQEVAALKKEEMELAERLMKEFPNSEDPIVLMGNVQSNHGNATEAMRYWEKGLELNPRRADVYAAMAWLAMAKADYDKAIARWRKALEIEPQMPGAHNTIGRALMGLGKQKDAIEEFKKDIQISPQSSVSYFWLGQAYLQMKEYDKAKENYETAVSLQPDLTNAYHGLLTVCTRLKQRAEAQEYMAIFNKLKAEDRKDLKGRKVAFDDATAMRKGVAKTYMHAGQMYRDRGDPQKALELLERAVALDPENTVYLMKLAALYGTSNQIAEALQVHKKISEIEPQNSLCHLNTGILSAKLKQYVDAEKAFRKVITLTPESSAGYRSLAQIYLETQRNLPAARELAEQAVALEATAANYFVLSWACNKNGDTANAFSAMKRAVELEPQNPRYQQTLRLIKERQLLP